jgi:hypothetical protein
MLQLCKTATHHSLQYQYYSHAKSYVLYIPIQPAVPEVLVEDMSLEDSPVHVKFTEIAADIFFVIAH